MPATLRLLAVLVMLTALAACEGGGQEFKEAEIPMDLALRGQGLEPSTPLPGVRATAYIEARGAQKVSVFYGFGDADPTEIVMDEVDAPDEFFWARYEAALPPMSADEPLNLYFEVSADGEFMRQPPSAPEEVLTFSNELPDLPGSYMTTTLPPTVARGCDPDPQRIVDEEECSGRYVLQFPTMTKPNFLEEHESTAIRTLQRGIGVDFGNGESYFFPLKVMLWHEGSNQTIGGMRTMMSYCPLTDTAVHFNTGFNPNNLGKNDEFLVSGAIFNSNLVMGLIHRLDIKSTFPQILAYGVFGPETGRCLDLLPTVMTDWNFWKAIHPETKIVEGDSQFPDYKYHQLHNPYTVYWTDDDEIRVPICNDDPRRPRKSRVMGIYGEGTPTAVIIGDQSFVYNTTIDGRPVVVTYVGSSTTGWVLERTRDGVPFELEMAGFWWNNMPILIDDAEEPSYYTPEGIAISGPAEGHRMGWVPSMNAFWFAWGAFFPETELVDPITGEAL